MLCEIWYHLHNLKNKKSKHGGVLLLVKLLVSACNFTKSNTVHGCFSRFLKCTNGIKSCKASHICTKLQLSVAALQNRAYRKNIFTERKSEVTLLSRIYSLTFTLLLQSSLQEMFFKNSVLKNFTKFLGEHLQCSPFFGKSGDLDLKKTLLQVFCCTFYGTFLEWVVGNKAKGRISKWW